LTSNSNAWAAAAKATRSITAWRSFKASLSDRYLWIQLIPLARVEDGPAALESLASPEGGMRNPRAIVTVVSTRDLDPAPGIAGATLVSATEQQTTSPNGSGTALALRFLVGKTVVIMMASSIGVGWTWPELVECAEIQANRLQTDR
jgi:hypothetical protein